MADGVKWITLAVAGYAAIVATVDLIWRLKEHRRARASLVSISAWWRTHAGVGDFIVLEIHNLSPEPVRITEYGWTNESGKSPHLRHGYGEGYELEVPARDGRVLEKSVASLVELDPSRPIVSWLRLTTGEEFTAPPVRVPEHHPLHREAERRRAERDRGAGKS